MPLPGGRTSWQMLHTCAVMCLQITFIDLSGLSLVTLELWNPEELGRKDENLCFLQLQQNWILAELAGDGILHYPKGWQGRSGRFAAISIWYFHSKPACITPHSLSCSPLWRLVPVYCLISPARCLHLRQMYDLSIRSATDAPGVFARRNRFQRCVLKRSSPLHLLLPAISHACKQERSLRLKRGQRSLHQRSPVLFGNANL